MERDARQDHSGGLTQEKDLRGRFCARPFVHCEIHREGKVTQCCPAWLDRPIGNFGKQSLTEIWNSENAKQVRESILDGSFRHCHRNWCPEIQGDRLPKISELDAETREIYESGVNAGALPRTIVLCYDESCNLSCPSCRTGRISYRLGTPEYQRSMEVTERLMADIFANPDSPVELHVAGLGDPFAAPVFRHLLEGLDGQRLPKLSLVLKTNGVMLTPKTFAKLSAIHRNIRQFVVSIDASTPETYAIVRRDGDWELLLENMRYLVEEKRRLSFRISGGFVVQRRNFREVAAFARLFLGMGFDDVHYLLVDNFGTWGSEENYREQCVWRTDHPEFAELMQVLRDPILSRGDVLLGNLAEYHRRAHAIPAAIQGSRG